jgi:hypothetical protein
MRVRSIARRMLVCTMVVSVLVRMMIIVCVVVRAVIVSVVVMTVVATGMRVCDSTIVLMQTEDGRRIAGLQIVQ